MEKTTVDGFRFVGCRAGAAIAQSTYPDRPLRLIIPWPPGQATDLAGSTDTFAEFLKNERARFAAIIRQANIKVE